MAQKAASPVDGAELIREVMRLTLNPGDILVFRTEAPARPEWKVYLEKQLSRLFPGNQVLVIDGEYDLFVIGEAQVDDTD